MKSSDVLKLGSVKLARSISTGLGKILYGKQMRGRNSTKITQMVELEPYFLLMTNTCHLTQTTFKKKNGGSGSNSLYG